MYRPLLASTEQHCPPSVDTIGRVAPVQSDRAHILMSSYSTVVVTTSLSKTCQARYYYQLVLLFLVSSPNNASSQHQHPLTELEMS